MASISPGVFGTTRRGAAAHRVASPVGPAPAYEGAGMCETIWA